MFSVTHSWVGWVICKSLFLSRRRSTSAREAIFVNESNRQMLGVQISLLFPPPWHHHIRLKIILKPTLTDKVRCSVSVALIIRFPQKHGQSTLLLDLSSHANQWAPPIKGGLSICRPLCEIPQRILDSCLAAQRNHRVLRISLLRTLKFKIPGQVEKTLLLFLPLHVDFE